MERLMGITDYGKKLRSRESISVDYLDKVRNAFLYEKAMNPNEFAKLLNFSYSSKNKIPFSVMTNVFFPSYSILFINPELIKFFVNDVNLE